MIRESYAADSGVRLLDHAAGVERGRLAPDERRLRA
jgi:hypothetical protein